MVGVIARRALLPALVLAAGCAGQGSSTTTQQAADPQQVAALEQQVADQAAQILELESSLAGLQAALDRAGDEARAAAARRDSLARMLEQARAQLEEHQESAAQRVQDRLNAYQQEVERLRALVPMPDTPEARAAVEALVAFLTAMRDGDYPTAAGLYGGTYEVLVDWNPPVDPSDHLALLEAACTHQLRCELTVRRVLGGFEVAEGLEFWVEFQDAAGQPWSLGPCCGSDTDPTVSQFPFVVAIGAPAPKVLTLPVYTP